MKKLFFISLLFIFSCSQPFARVDTSDEKSIIIKKIFEEVSNERIDYLKEVFSDDMMKARPATTTTPNKIRDLLSFIDISLVRLN